MTEVSCRVVPYYLRAEEEGLCSLDALTAGLPVSRAELLDPQNRVAWDVWAEMCDRFAAHVGSDQILADTGRLGFDPRIGDYSLGRSVAGPRRASSTGSRFVGRCPTCTAT